MISTLKTLAALFLANVRAYAIDKKRLYVMSLAMCLQNTMFFVLWVIFFNHVGSISGWDLVDVTRMFGMVASVCGLSLFFCDGLRTIPYKVSTGAIDFYITKPRHPLPAIMFSSSSPASLGDVFYAPTLYLLIQGVLGIPVFTLSMVPLFLVLTILSTILFLATMCILFSLSFWLKGNPRFSGQLFEMLVIFSCNVLHGQPWGVKAIIFTVLPVGFISYLPIELLRSFDLRLFLAILTATVFYTGLAILIFNKGLRHYVRAKV
jgi:ABC-2 type transport system permease protein